MLGEWYYLRWLNNEGLNYMSDNGSDHKDRTKLIHLGRDVRASKGFVNPPLYRGSTVLFPTVQSMSEGGYGYWYGRKGSPTFDALEAALNELEGADETILTPSGLSAITTSLLGLLKAGDHILVTDSAYQPTRSFCDSTLKALNIETTYYDPRIGNEIETLIKENTAVIFLESPGSQSFEIQDVPAIVKVAKQHDIATVIDNTWATPLRFKPLTFGVDVSLHSGTKYFIGHADALIGTISATKKAGAAIRRTAWSLGICPGPDDVQLALRGLRTLAIRLDQHEKAALELATWLEGRDEVETVLHPGLASHPDHALFKRDFTGSTGLFSVILKPVDETALARFVDGLSLFAMGWSWGGYESLVIPFEPRPYRSATQWPFEGPALRFHIGHEDMNDLKADLETGFQRLQG